jgi:drug/metabolite transporter (DMT)-like permease
MSACTDQWTGFDASEIDMQHHASRAKLILAFGAVWFFWGTTYIAIALAVGNGLPPFLMAGARWFTAGFVLYLYTIVRSKGAVRPNRINWASAILVGGLLILAGNGTLSYIESMKVPATIAALFIATEPLWVVLLNWAWPGGVRPDASKFVGVTLGLLGVGLLLRVTGTGGGWNATLLILAAFCWAFGSIISSKVRVTTSSLMAAAMQMLMGGALALLFGLITGEGHQMQVHPSLSMLVSIFAFCYLIVCGSLIAFCSYNWLLKVTTPSRASSFAYVNPVVALVVGWSLSKLAWLVTKFGWSTPKQLTQLTESGIPLERSMWLAAALIVVAVAIVTCNWSWKNRGPRNLRTLRKEKS